MRTRCCYLNRLTLWWNSVKSGSCRVLGIIFSPTTLTSTTSGTTGYADTALPEQLLLIRCGSNIRFHRPIT